MPLTRFLTVLFAVIAAAGLTVALAALLSGSSGVPVAALSALALCAALILRRALRP